MIKQRKNILLHACCAPCGTHPIRLLSKQFITTVFFYNPNIDTAYEYEKRENEIRCLCEKWEIPFIKGDYDSKLWFKAVEGHENDQEGGERCSICFRFRMEKTAQKAREIGLSHFTTTLTISPHKNTKQIHAIGLAVGEKFNVQFYQADFKKWDGFKIAGQICKEEGLYRQNYCGCLFSHRDRYSRISRG